MSICYLTSSKVHLLAIRPSLIISVFYLRKSCRVFGKREIIANALVYKYLLLLRLMRFGHFLFCLVRHCVVYQDKGMVFRIPQYIAVILIHSRPWAHISSTSETVLGIGLPRIRLPSSVMSRSSSIRMPPKSL